MKNKSYINLKDASIQCIKDISNLLLKDQQIKNIFLSGGKSLDAIKDNLSKLKLKKKNNLFLTDERVTKQKSYLNSIKIKKIKNKNIRFRDNFNLKNLKNLNKINKLLPKKNYIVIMGVGEDAELFDSISVTVIATGFNVDQQNEISNTEPEKIIHSLEEEDNLFNQKPIELDPWDPMGALAK